MEWRDFNSDSPMSLACLSFQLQLHQAVWEVRSCSPGAQVELFRIWSKDEKEQESLLSGSQILASENCFAFVANFLGGKRGGIGLNPNLGIVWKISHSVEPKGVRYKAMFLVDVNSWSMFLLDENYMLFMSIDIARSGSLFRDDSCKLVLLPQSYS